MLWRRRGRGRLTFSHPVETFSEGGGEKCWVFHYQTPTYRTVFMFCPTKKKINGSIIFSPCTHLFNQGLVLVWLAEVAADVLCRDSVLLAFVHPALVLFLLRETVPEDLKSLPYGLLAHWSHQRVTPHNWRTCCFHRDIAHIFLEKPCKYFLVC